MVKLEAIKSIKITYSDGSCRTITGLADIMAWLRIIMKENMVLRKSKHQ